MSEWHVTPDYVVGHWSTELFELMVERLTQRRERQNAAHEQ